MVLDFVISQRGESFRCSICADRPHFDDFAGAQIHEGTLEHVLARRQLDQPCTPPMAASEAFDGSSLIYIPDPLTSILRSPLRVAHSSPELLLPTQAIQPLFCPLRLRRFLRLNTVLT